MLPLLIALALTQQGPKVIVVDVSAPDAVYEDVSRGLADDLVAALKKAGLPAERVDENELPEEGCRLGPCLGIIARAKQARCVVILDATELDKKRTGVSVAAMAGHNGMPLTAKRYVVKSGGKPPKEIDAFVAEVARQLFKAFPPAADAGTPDAGALPASRLKP